MKKREKLIKSIGSDLREFYSSLEEAALLSLHLGFHVHPEKSVLIASQSLTFLGFNLNSVSMTVTLTQEKRDQLESGPSVLRL